MNFVKGFNEMNQTHLRNTASFFAGSFLNKNSSALLLCVEFKMVERRVWGKDLVFSVPNKGRAKMRDKMNEGKKEKEQQMRFKNIEVVVTYFKRDRVTEVCLQSLENVPRHLEPTAPRSLRKTCTSVGNLRGKCACAVLRAGAGGGGGELCCWSARVWSVRHAAAWLNLTKHRCLSRGP